MIKLGELLGVSRERAEHLVNKYDPIALEVPDVTEVSELLSEKDIHQFYITKNVLDHCQKIKVKEPFDLEWLAPIPDGKKQLNFGDKFVRYNKIGSKINALVASGNKSDKGSKPIRYSFFNMDLSSKEISTPEMEDYYDLKQEKESFLDFDAASRKLFFQLITFIKLAEVEEIMVKPKSKHGVKKAPANLLNQETFPIRVIDINWNKTIITEGFGVKFHYRLQRCGPNFSKRELIPIHPYQKKGYNLKARKLDDRNRGPRI